MPTMHDSTNAADVPDGGDAYAGYVDGNYQDYSNLVERFPGKPVLAISATGEKVAACGDAEPKCIWPPSVAVSWAHRTRAAGIEPIIYCGRYNWPDVIAAFQEAGEPEPRWWVAHYTNIPHLCSDACLPSRPVGGRVAIGTQYGGDLPGHFDTSLIADDFFSPPPIPQVSQAISVPEPVQEDEDMLVIHGCTDPAFPQAIITGVLDVPLYLPPGTDMKAYQDQGAKTVYISAKPFKEIHDRAVGL